MRKIEGRGLAPIIPLRTKGPEKPAGGGRIRSQTLLLLGIGGLTAIAGGMAIKSALDLREARAGLARAAAGVGSMKDTLTGAKEVLRSTENNLAHIREGFDEISVSFGKALDNNFDSYLGRANEFMRSAAGQASFNTSREFGFIAVDFYSHKPSRWKATSLSVNPATAEIFLAGRMLGSKGNTILAVKKFRPGEQGYRTAADIARGVCRRALTDRPQDQDIQQLLGYLGK